MWSAHMPQNVRFAVLTIFALAIMSFKVVNYSFLSQWNTAPTTNPNASFQSRFLLKNKTRIGTIDTNIQKEENYSNIIFRELYVEPPNAVPKRRFLYLSEKGIKYFESLKPPRPELQKEGNALRKQNLMNRCKGENVDPLIDLSRFIYDDKLKIVMCVVPKAACTTWKRYFSYWKGMVEKADIMSLGGRNLTLGNSKSYLRALSSLPKPEAMKRLWSYTSFFVMRHPLERLTSAYSSKFTERKHDLKFKEKFTPTIARYTAESYLKQLNISYAELTRESLVQNKEFDALDSPTKEKALQLIDNIESGNISFLQFAKFVTRSNKTRFQTDIHWRSHVDLCNPCAVNYDFIVRFENLIEDSNFLLEFIQQDRRSDEKIFFDTSRPSKINAEKTAQSIQALDAETIDNLLQNYDDDFRILGYSASIK